MRVFVIAAALALSLATPVLAQTTTATTTTAAPAAAGALTTAATPIGDLLDNPAAKAVLVTHVPDLVNNPQIDMARTMTLKSIQAYAPNLTDDVLASIDADLAKLPRTKRAAI